MLIYETMGRDGTLRAIHLEANAGSLELCFDEVRASVPARVVIALMRRYGRPANDGVDTSGEELRLDAGTVLRRFRFRAGVDVVGRDYLALIESGGEPILAMATTIAGALEHLARARS